MSVQSIDESVFESGAAFSAPTIAVLLLGSRDSTAGRPLLGLSPVVRTLFALERAGFRTAYLVTEAPLPGIESAIRNARRLVIQTYWLPVSDWEATTAKEHPGCPLLVIDGPLLLLPDTLRRAVEHPTPDSNSGLALRVADSSRTMGLKFDQKVPSRLEGAGRFQEARSALLQGLIKPTDGPVSRKINRPISIRISRILASTPITPNQVTLITTFLGVAAGPIAAVGGYWPVVVAALLIQISSILDGVDGEIARLKFMDTHLGQWLDTLGDNLSYLSGLIGFVVAGSRAAIPTAIVHAGWVTVILMVPMLLNMYVYLLRNGLGGSLLNVDHAHEGGDHIFARLLRLLSPLGRRDMFSMVILMLAILGLLGAILLYVGVMVLLLFVVSLQINLAGRGAR